MESLTSDLFNGPKIGASDLEGLHTLATQMRSCALKLRQLGRAGNLDSHLSLLRLVERFPRGLQERWAELVEVILSRGKEPSFEDLLEFVDRRISVASNSYGRLAARSASGTAERPQYYQRGEALKFRSNARIAAVNSSYERLPGCPLCKAQHSLDTCPEFASMPMIEKRAVLNSHKCCFICLKVNHLAKNCRVPVQCRVPDCGRRHHTIMHVEKEATIPIPKTDISKCGATSLNGKVRLGFVPVRLVGPKGAVETYAFLDNGSDTTLILNSIAEAIGLEAQPIQIKVSTVHGTKLVECGEASLNIQSLGKDVEIRVDKAYTTEYLPFNRVEPLGPGDEQRCSHLSDVKFPSTVDDCIGILIGGNVSEAHWVLELKDWRT